jgi:hypothetical protein
LHPKGYRVHGGPGERMSGGSIASAALCLRVLARPFTAIDPSNVITCR